MHVRRIAKTSTSHQNVEDINGHSLPTRSYKLMNTFHQREGRYRQTLLTGEKKNIDSHFSPERRKT
jgi:hypothetical protein